MEIKVITYFLGKLFSVSITLLIIPFFISWFGQEKYGEYILLYTTFLIFLSGSIGWINQSMIKFHADFDNNKDEYYSKVHNLTSQVSIIASIPLIIFVYFNLLEVSILLLVFIALSFVIACKYTSKLIENQTRLNSVKFTVAEFLRLLIYFCSVFFLKDLFFINELEAIFASLLLAYFSGFLFLNKGIQKVDVKLNFKIDKVLLKKYLVFGFPLGVWMMFSPGANGIDRYIINYSLGAIALTQYTAVYDVVFKVFTQLANPINSVYQPLLMKMHSKGDLIFFNKTLKRAILYLLIICVPVFIVVYVLQDFILINYLGFENREVIEILKQIILPLMLSSLIWQIAIIAQKQLEAKEKTLAMTLILLSVIFFYSIITIWLIPYFGILIMAYISVLASISYLVLIILFNKHENRKKLFN
jgi:O-antigen/teichoic acid export membrane protein